MQQEFESIEEEITSTVQLTHFDPSTPAVIETDASLKSLGVHLPEANQPCPRSVATDVAESLDVQPSSEVHGSQKRSHS